MPHGLQLYRPFKDCCRTMGDGLASEVDDEVASELIDVDDREVVEPGPQAQAITHGLQLYRPFNDCWRTIGAGMVSELIEVDDQEVVEAGLEAPSE